MSAAAPARLALPSPAAAEVSEELVEWAREVARHVRRRLPAHFDAEDLEQTAIIAAWQAVGEYDAERGVPFSAFAYPLVRYACLMSVRRRHWKNAQHDPLPESLTDPAPPPDELADREGARRHVRRLIDTLPERERQVLALHYTAEVPMAQVAEQMAISPKLAYALRGRGLTLLRAELKRRGLDRADLGWS